MVDFEEELVEYLKKNGAIEIPDSNVERLKLLRRIVYNEKVNLDIVDMKYAKDKENGVADVNVYIDRLHEIQGNIHDALYYVSNVSGMVKEEKKLKRKTLFKRIFGIKGR